MKQAKVGATRILSVTEWWCSVSFTFRPVNSQEKSSAPIIMIRVVESFVDFYQPESVKCSVRREMCFNERNEYHFARKNGIRGEKNSFLYWNICVLWDVVPYYLV
jgi:hypothetical protein